MKDVFHFIGLCRTSSQMRLYSQLIRSPRRFMIHASKSIRHNTLSDLSFWEVFLPELQTIIKIILSILPPMFSFYVMEYRVDLLSEEVRWNKSDLPEVRKGFFSFWLINWVAIIIVLKTVVARIFLFCSFLYIYILFLTNSIYFRSTGFFFRFTVLRLAGEGSPYLWHYIVNCDRRIWLDALLLPITLAISSYLLRRIPRSISNVRTFLIFILLLWNGVRWHHRLEQKLGPASDKLIWDDWTHSRTVYERFHDSNKNMKICGLLEFVLRDLYVTLLKPANAPSAEELSMLKRFYSHEVPHGRNNYTGLFQGRNLILIQLEGLDSWLLTNATTPYLFSLADHGFHFINNFSFQTNGGSTFNSEFCVNTGFMTPVSFPMNAYDLVDNHFPFSLSRQFALKGYTSLSFHMNSKEFYNRGLNYQSWGYKRYHSLRGDYNYNVNDPSVELDRELILNKNFSNYLFNTPEPFLHYIITYTVHPPFSLMAYHGKLLAKKLGISNPETYDEEASAKVFAGETDRMVGLLLDGLQQTGRLNNTVIVAFTDHYIHTFLNSSITSSHKSQDNNLLFKTPFLIWGKGINPETIVKFNSQVDILPTLLNLFGFSYFEDWYIGSDVFNPNNPGYVIFPDSTWYDGPTYRTDLVAPAADLLARNDLTLKYDYFRDRSLGKQ